MSPIRPDEIGKKKAQIFPPEVFEAFDAEIAARYEGNSAKVYQKDIVERLVAKGHSSSTIFDKGWLNVEEAYKEAGWSVRYHKMSDWTESGDSYFTFTKLHDHPYTGGLMS